MPVAKATSLAWPETKEVPARATGRRACACLRQGVHQDPLRQKAGHWSYTPEGVWYNYYFDKANIDKIIDEHLVGGRVGESPWKRRMPPHEDSAKRRARPDRRAVGAGQGRSGRPTDCWC